MRSAAKTRIVWYYVNFFAAIGLAGMLLISISMHLAPGHADGGTDQSETQHVTPVPSRRRHHEKPRFNQLIHICLGSDDTDLRPVVVCIRSVVAVAAKPEQLVFHFVSTRSIAVRLQRLARVHLAGIDLKVYYNETWEARTRELIALKSGSESIRRGLQSPFNFAAYYLGDFIGTGGGPRPRRIVYIDTDTVLMGDIGELNNTDLHGHPCGAVKYCHQRLEHYIDMDAVNRLSSTQFHPRTCIANRGVLIIDLPLWQERRFTPKIEEWMQRATKAEKPLWRGGVSQPPWLLAMGEDYWDIGEKWNCAGLGRSSLSSAEILDMQMAGYDDVVFEELDVLRPSGSGGIVPAVITCSLDSKLLHFNGAVKPWLLEKDRSKHLPLCQVPQRLPTDIHKWTLEKRVSVSKYKVHFVACREIWDMFYDAHSALKANDDDTSSGDTIQLLHELSRLDAMFDSAKNAQNLDVKDDKEPENVRKSQDLAEVFPGGFTKHQEVRAAGNIMVRGKVVVAQGTRGVVQGPSVRHPRERLNVLFTERKDGKRRTVNVMPQEIQPVNKT